MTSSNSKRDRGSSQSGSSTPLGLRDPINYPAYGPQGSIPVVRSCIPDAGSKYLSYLWLDLSTEVLVDVLAARKWCQTKFSLPPLLLWSRPIFARPVQRKSLSPAETLAATGRIELFSNWMILAIWDSIVLIRFFKCNA